MKTLKCDLCDVTAEGETFEDWMNAPRLGDLLLRSQHEQVGDTVVL